MSFLAERCPVPVRIEVDLPRAPSCRRRGRGLLRRERSADERGEARRMPRGRLRPDRRPPAHAGGRRRRLRWRRPPPLGQWAAGADGSPRHAGRVAHGGQPAERWDAAPCGDPVRVILADDAVLFREGAARSAGCRVRRRGPGGRRDRAAGARVPRAAGCGRHRHPHAAGAHDRGARCRCRAPADPSLRRSAAPVPARRDPLRRAPR